MRLLLLAAPLLLSGCLATATDLERASAEIVARVNSAAQEAAMSAEAAREAWRRGDITYAELQDQLEDVRSAVLDSGKDISREVINDVKDTIRDRPNVIADTASDVARTFLPGPWGEILAGLLGGAGAYFAASRKSTSQVQQLAQQRDINRLARGEPVNLPNQPPRF